MWVFPKNRGTPKWMAYDGKSYKRLMIWGYHYVWKHPHHQQQQQHHLESIDGDRPTPISLGFIMAFAKLFATELGSGDRHLLSQSNQLQLIAKFDTSLSTLNLSSKWRLCDEPICGRCLGFPPWDVMIMGPWLHRAVTTVSKQILRLQGKYI